MDILRHKIIPKYFQCGSVSLKLSLKCQCTPVAFNMFGNTSNIINVVLCKTTWYMNAIYYKNEFIIRMKSYN